MAHVRVVNKTRGRFIPAPGETVVDVDRSNRELGNPYYLAEKGNDAERDRVCDSFERMAESDMARGGPVRRAVMDLAARVAGGESLALACWCAPRRCHGDWIARRVREEAELIARREGRGD